MSKYKSWEEKTLWDTDPISSAVLLLFLSIGILPSFAVIASLFGDYLFPYIFLALAIGFPTWAIWYYSQPLFGKTSNYE